MDEIAQLEQLRNKFKEDAQKPKPKPEPEPITFEDAGKNCPICGKPLRYAVVLGVKIPASCSCVEKKAQAEKDRIERQSKVLQIYERSNLSPSQRKIRFEDFESRPGTEKCLAACKKYVATFKDRMRDGMGLYIYGATGCGKTKLACAVANELIGQATRVVYWNVTSLLQMIRESYDTHISAADSLYSARNAQLLILDDLGAEKATEWTRSALYDVINARIENNRPTLVTSNLQPESLEPEVGPRISSRLCDKTRFARIANLATDYRINR